MSEEIRPGFGGWEIVNISKDKPYIPNSWRKVECIKCGYMWTYKGEGFVIKCSQCGDVWTNPDYMRAYNEGRRAKKNSYMRSYRLSKKVLSYQIISSYHFTGR